MKVEGDNDYIKGLSTAPGTAQCNVNIDIISLLIILQEFHSPELLQILLWDPQVWAVVPDH